MWKLEIQNMTSNVKYYTTLKNNRELGTFLLGLNNREFRILEIKEIPDYKVKESREFLKKNEKLECGN